LLIAGACFAIGWGLWELRDWARLATIILAGLSLVGGLVLGVILLFGVIKLGGVTLQSPGVGIAYVVSALINGLVIWYLTKPDIQGLFTGAAGYSGGGATWDAGGGAGFSAGGVTASATGVPSSWNEPAPTPIAVPPTARESLSRPAPSAAPPPDRTRPLHEPEPVAGWLVARGGPRPGDQLKLRAGTNTVGRDGRRAQLVVDESSVSGEHAKIRFESGVFVIYDLASTNGTYVNGRRVEKARLMDNDVVRLGRQEFVFKMVDPRHR
jgi:hypothetical protein